jgi:hypothetical protein
MGNRELAERFIATLEARDWDAWAGLLHPAVVYEIPQSRERIRGRDRYLRFNREYPGDWHLRPKVTIADERHGVVWFEWLLDGRTDDAMAFFEFADGLITRVTDFWPEPYEPPPGREHLVERWLPAPAHSAESPAASAYMRGPHRCGALIRVCGCTRAGRWSSAPNASSAAPHGKVEYFALASNLWAIAEFFVRGHSQCGDPAAVAPGGARGDGAV